MKRNLMVLVLAIIALQFYPTKCLAAQSEFDSFLNSFNYEVRDEMKIDSKGLVPLLTSGKAILVDVRFVEEVAAWRVGYSLNIPLNEFPKRISELPKDKIIVAACPHKDRSAIAMAYLRSKGYNAKYLTDGLIGLAEQLRGENAKDFIEDMTQRDRDNPPIKQKK